MNLMPTTNFYSLALLKIDKMQFSKIIKIKTEKMNIYYCSNIFTAINHNAYCIVVVFMEKLNVAMIMRYKYRT